MPELDALQGEIFALLNQLRVASSTEEVHRLGAELQAKMAELRRLRDQVRERARQEAVPA